MACRPDLPENPLTAQIYLEIVMTTIRVKENEPYEVALRRFKRTIEKLGLLTDLRAREFYEAHRRAQAQEGCCRQTPLQARTQHATA